MYCKLKAEKNGYISNWRKIGFNEHSVSFKVKKKDNKIYNGCKTKQAHIKERKITLWIHKNFNFHATLNTS